MRGGFPIEAPLPMRLPDRSGSYKLFLQSFFDCGSQHLVAASILDQPSIDKQRRRTTHTTLFTPHEIIPDDIQIFIRVQTLVEWVLLQTEVVRKALQVLFAEGADVLAGLFREQFIVIIPESTLLSGAFRSFRGPQRFGPQKGEMTEDETDLAGRDVFFFKLTLRASGKQPAVGSLEVTVLFHDHRSGGIPFAFF